MSLLYKLNSFHLFYISLLFIIINLPYSLSKSLLQRRNSALLLLICFFFNNLLHHCLSSWQWYILSWPSRWRSQNFFLHSTYTELIDVLFFPSSLAIECEGVGNCSLICNPDPPEHSHTISMTSLTTLNCFDLLSFSDRTLFRCPFYFFQIRWSPRHHSLSRMRLIQRLLHSSALIVVSHAPSVTLKSNRSEIFDILLHLFLARAQKARSLRIFCHALFRTQKVWTLRIFCHALLLTIIKAFDQFSIFNYFIIHFSMFKKPCERFSTFSIATITTTLWKIT